MRTELTTMLRSRKAERSSFRNRVRTSRQCTCGISRVRKRTVDADQVTPLESNRQWRAERRLRVRALHAELGSPPRSVGPQRLYGMDSGRAQGGDEGGPQRHEAQNQAGRTRRQGVERLDLEEEPRE